MAGPNHEEGMGFGETPADSDFGPQSRKPQPYLAVSCPHAKILVFPGQAEAE